MDWLVSVSVVCAAPGIVMRVEIRNTTSGNQGAQLMKSPKQSVRNEV